MTRSRFQIKVSDANVKYYQCRITGMIILPEEYTWSNGYIDKVYRVYENYPETLEDYDHAVAIFFSLNNARKYIMEGCKYAD